MGQVIYVDFVRKRILGASADSNVDALESIINPIDREKMDFFEQSMVIGLTTTMINTSVDGVVVPEEHSRHPSVPIDWSYKFNIPDFKFDISGIRGTLSFNKKPFAVFVPWSSVWMITSKINFDHNQVWIDNVPPEAF